MSRDYAYEALSEVTSTDQGIGRGQLNAALKQIRLQEPELTDSFLLSAEIHNRAKMYHALWPEMALTPTALAKHWLRVKEESGKVRGVNLHADPNSSLPALPKREYNLAQAKAILEKLSQS